jgi:hypothetical protein
VFRVNLANGKCTTPGAGAITDFGIQAVVPGLTPGHLLVGHRTLGLADMNVTPGSQFDGMLIQPWAGAPITSYSLYWSPGNDFLYGRDVTGGALPLVRFEPFATPTLRFPITDIVNNVYDTGVQSADRRWLMFGSALVDLESHESFPLPDTFAVSFGIAHPTQTTVITVNNAYSPLRYDIQE